MNSIATVAALIGGMIGTAGFGGILKILFNRIGKLEQDIKTERVRCDSEMRILRHRERNQRTLIYSLMHLFDLPAKQRQSMLVNFRSELGEIEKAEALEIGAAIAQVSGLTNSE